MKYQEDSGGRYCRHVVWQREYEGVGWVGTIAYVDSLYGDGTRQDIPEFILVCPAISGLTCFTLEIRTGRLKEKESEEIPPLLHDVIIETSRQRSGLPAGGIARPSP
jgi:hypothetical protein